MRSRRAVPVETAAAPSAAAPVSEDARERLLFAGLRLFADQGFTKTSTRELAETAGVNIAAISYYFGDKAGLYRAALMEPMLNRGDELAFAAPTLGFCQALRTFFERFLGPLRQGDVARLCMKLHLREMLEPSGLFEGGKVEQIRPVHVAFTALLTQRLGLAEPDDEVRRLAVCIAGLGVHLHIGRDVTEAVAPGLYDGPAAIDTWAERLMLFALAMIQAEAQRRGIKLADEGRSPLSSALRCR